MSENEVNACDKAGGDSIDATNVSRENLLPPTTCQQSEQTAVCQVASGDAQHLEKDDNSNTKKSDGDNNNDNSAVSQLREEVLKRTQERDEFRKKLEESELKLSILSQLSAGGDGSGDNELRRELQELQKLFNQTKISLEDRDRRLANQDNQISALCKQVSSLKEVVAITKDMLGIRNMEVKHLQEDIDKMEAKIAAERDRHNAIVGKMDTAVRLNADLKREYQTQLQLFQDLRGKYEEKVTLLSEENKALETAARAQPAQ